MSEAEFTEFLATVFRNQARHSADGAIHFICMDWRHLGEVLAAGKSAYSELKNLCVWAKTNGGMGSLYRSQHELVFVFKAGNGPHINNVELGKHGRYRTNIWSYPGINSFGKDRDAELALHPTVKPVKLVADAILDCSKRGGIVLDPFAGSGTTLVAAERTGRRGYGIELDPLYIDVIIRRMAAARHRQILRRDRARARRGGRGGGRPPARPGSLHSRGGRVMSDEETPSGDYEVGYGKPPKEHQFQPGRSGNIRGRRRSKKSGSTDISELLNEPVKVTTGGKAQEMGSFEAGLRKLAKRAVDGHLPSILKFTKICEEYEILAPPPAATGGGVIFAPKGVDYGEWLESVTELVPIDEE
jgi:hypothetical protein